MNEYIKKHGRTLDLLLLQDRPDKDQRILEELMKYQNMDGGFGHGLELDLQTPISNIPSTNIACQYLERVGFSEEKKAMIAAILTYYQATFYEGDKRWHMVEKEIDKYPRAVWWNYENRDAFSVLNPTPEILGFLYQHQDQVTTINLEQEIERMVSRIHQYFPTSKSFHELLSILYFYQRIPYIRKDLEQILQSKIQEFLTQTEEDYHLRAHQVFLIAPSMVEQDLLTKDIEELKYELSSKGYIACSWQWFQYNETFEEIKALWNAYLTRQAIEAIQKFEEEN